MSDDDAFLSRWSRRKREVERETALKEGAPKQSQLASDEEAARGLAERDAPLDEATLAERIAALPSIDDICETTDVTPFMQTWVPNALRTQALRKLWTVDRAVREHVIFADYALDYNAPGGAPGYGSFEGSIEMAKRALESFSRDPATIAVESSGTRDGASSDEEAASHSDSPDPTPLIARGAAVFDESELDLGLIEDSTSPLDRTLPRAADDAPHSVAMREEPVPPPTFGARRRHGSAAPR